MQKPSKWNPAYASHFSCLFFVSFFLFLFSFLFFLVYSELDQGGYCKYCVLFGQCAYSVTSFVGVLISRPLTNLQKASEKLREHF